MTKVNPRKKPATMADVKRAKDEATTQALNLVITVVVYVLKDKFDWSDERLGRLSRQVNKTISMIAEGRLTLADIKHTLREEYDLNTEMRIE